MIGEPYSYVASFVGYALLLNARNLAGSIKFYYALGIALGVVAGLYLLSRDREGLRQFAMTLHVAFGSAWLYAPELTLHLKAAYLIAAGGAGFAATHIYLHNVDFTNDPRVDVVRWALTLIALALIAIGDLLLNAVMIIGSIGYFSMLFCFLRCRRTNAPPSMSISQPIPQDSDDEAIVFSDDSDDEETERNRLLYLLEGRTRAYKQEALLQRLVKNPPARQARVSRGEQ